MRVAGRLRFPLLGRTPPGRRSPAGRGTPRRAASQPRRARPPHARACHSACRRRHPVAPRRSCLRRRPRGPCRCLRVRLPTAALQRPSRPHPLARRGRGRGAPGPRVPRTRGPAGKSRQSRPRSARRGVGGSILRAATRYAARDAPSAGLCIAELAQARPGRPRVGYAVVGGVVRRVAHASAAPAGTSTGTGAVDLACTSWLDAARHACRPRGTQRTGATDRRVTALRAPRRRPVN